MAKQRMIYGLKTNKLPTFAPRIRWCPYGLLLPVYEPGALKSRRPSSTYGRVRQRELNDCLKCHKLQTPLPAPLLAPQPRRALHHIGSSRQHRIYQISLLKAAKQDKKKKNALELEERNHKWCVIWGGEKMASPEAGLRYKYMHIHD